MNIEHEYMTLTGEYKPFEGICLVDTFQLAEPAQQMQMAFMSEENTERVKQQKEKPIFVIIGNPPYNVGQVNENDNNKNRKYPTMDKRVSETYAKDSRATLVSQLSDPYVKAFRWASDRIGNEGVVAFITNNSFIDGIAFDGMRKHLEHDFSKIYHVDLKGNARTSGERRQREAGNVFDDAIRVGVGITFLVKKQGYSGQADIYIKSIDDYLRSKDKRTFLEKAEYHRNVEFTKMTPDASHTWITEGMHDEFKTFLPMGTKEGKIAKGEIETIFKIYSRGICSNGDAYVYDHDEVRIVQRAESMIEDYNSQRDKWIQKGQPQNVEEFLHVDEKVLKWIRRTKRSLLRGIEAKFVDDNIRTSIYRPFCKQFLYFERIFNEDVYRFPQIFPVPETENENYVIAVVNEAQIPFSAQITNHIPCLHYGGRQTQCFPFYTYSEDASNRSENLTDWALAQFRTHYQDDSISKWNIFYYVYGLLHHPQYREKYAANLNRELPRIPFASDFWAFANAGETLADLHINYEQQPQYPLRFIEKEGEQLDWRVEKMKLSKDKSQIIYNQFLTLAGIPSEAFEYRLGNKSALHWIIDQYRVKIDKRSGIVNDPNRADEPDYIVNLIRRVITVSLETVKIIKNFPKLDIIK